MLKLAGEHNVDLDLVEGTGANGRITRKDILKLVESKYSASRCSEERGSCSGSSRSSPEAPKAAPVAQK